MKNIIKSLTVLLACLLCLSFSSCEKEEVLPAETQTGEGTFGCYVNGKLWVPKGKLLDDIMDLSYNPKSGWMNIYARNYELEPRESINISFDSLFSKNTYLVSTKDNAVITYRRSNCFYSWDNSTFYEGYVHIKKLDLESRIIAGTFELTAKIPDCDTLRITQGRFDMKI